MLFIFFLGIFPALFFMSFKFRLPNIFKRILISGALCVQLLAVTFLLSSTWLWFDANASAFGSRVLPWSYLVNTLRYNDKRIESGRIVAKLPTGTFKKLDKANINTRQIVILVIGESARAMNFSWYGYQKDTNIYTRKAGFVPLDSSETCATYTRASLECILSVNGRDALDFEKTENLLSYLSRMGIKTIVRRNNTGLPNVKVNLFQSASDLYELCVAPGCIETELDEILLAGFEDLITNEDSIRTFITFHLSGSHGPRYNQKYRKEFEVFTPVCNDVRLKKCDDETLKNAYDNSLLYTDHLLATIAEIASKQKNAEVLILYTSDHGESLGEYNLYLHGAPKSVAPKEQLMVPFLLWMNDLYSNRIKSTQNVSPNYSIPAQDAIFHTVLGVFGINDGPYDASRDIFAGH
jgi:lipid A ethanolaminephosphotransferase